MPSAAPLTRRTRSRLPAISCATTAELVLTPLTMHLWIRSASGHDDDVTAPLSRVDDRLDSGIYRLTRGLAEAMVQAIDKGGIGLWIQSELLRKYVATLFDTIAGGLLQTWMSFYRRDRSCLPEPFRPVSELIRQPAVADRCRARRASMLVSVAPGTGRLQRLRVAEGRDSMLKRHIYCACAAVLKKGFWVSGWNADPGSAHPVPPGRRGNEACRRQAIVLPLLQRFAVIHNSSIATSPFSRNCKRSS